jgi:hypothetical protein
MEVLFAIFVILHVIILILMLVSLVIVVKIATAVTVNYKMESQNVPPKDMVAILIMKMEKLFQDRA